MLYFHHVYTMLIVISRSVVSSYLVVSVGRDITSWTLGHSGEEYCSTNQVVQSTTCIPPSFVLALKLVWVDNHQEVLQSPASPVAKALVPRYYHVFVFVETVTVAGFLLSAVTACESQ